MRVFERAGERDLQPGEMLLVRAGGQKEFEYRKPALPRGRGKAGRRLHPEIRVLPDKPASANAAALRERAGLSIRVAGSASLADPEPRGLLPSRPLLRVGAGGLGQPVLDSPLLLGGGQEGPRRLPQSAGQLLL